jgi:hypothetical protein
MSMHSDDLVRPDLRPLHGDDPYPLVSKLRDECPVHRATGPEGQAVFYVTRHADALATLNDPRLSVDKAYAAPGAWNGYPMPAALDANLLNVDGADHARVRRHAASAFAGARLRAVTDSLESLATSLLEEAAAEAGQGNTVDLVSRLAMPIAARAICAVLGADAAGTATFTGWTACLLDPARREEYPSVLRELLGFLVRALDAAAREHTGGLFEDIAEARVLGELSGDEALSLAFLTFFAGFDNSCNLTAQALLRVLTDPSAHDAAQTAAGLEALLAETARRDGPVMVSIRRFAVEELQISGVPIPAGSPVLIGIASADRDPAEFEDPQLFDAGRTAGTSLAFGAGPHACIGRRLALAEAAAAVRALTRGYPDARLAVAQEALTFRPATRTRGLVELPVRLTEGRG